MGPIANLDEEKIFSWFIDTCMQRKVGAIIFSFV